MNFARCSSRRDLPPSRLSPLVLGIAANVAIFTFVDAALLRPLPYRDASRLMEVYDTRSMDVNTQFEASYPDYLDWRAQQQVFDGLAGYGQNQVLLRGAGAPELLPSAVATDNFFQTIGVHPLAGRDFRAGEDLASAPRTGDAELWLVAAAFWRQRCNRARRSPSTASLQPLLACCRQIFILLLSAILIYGLRFMPAAHCCNAEICTG